MWTVSSHRHQHTRVPLAAALSLFMSLLYPPDPWGEWCNVWRLVTPPGSTSPTLFKQWGGGLFTSHKNQTSVSAVTYVFFFCPYPKRLADVITKAALSFQLFRTLSVGLAELGWGLNLRPPTQLQTGALPTELTRWKESLHSRRSNTRRPTHSSKFTTKLAQ